MTSALICSGEVMHARCRTAAGEHANPTRNGFAYPLFFVAVPLSAWGKQNSLWLGYDRRAALAVNARDHGPRDGSPLLPWVRSLLQREGVTSADGEIVLQAFPRVFGLIFNPVSFWFCHDRAGGLRAVLAEVNNTFGERHNYLLMHPEQRPINNGEVLQTRKVFHVSPFYPTHGEYRFRFFIDADRRRAEIDYYLDGERALLTAVTGAVQTLSASTARRTVLRFPLLAVGVLARIHWQALRLWLKGAYFFRKPAPPHLETTR